MFDDQFAKKDEPTNSNPLPSDGFTINLSPIGSINELSVPQAQDNCLIPEGVKVHLFSQNHGYYDPNLKLGQLQLDEEVAKDQFDSLHFIMRHRDALIFPEGATNAYTIKDNPAFNKDRKVAKEVFIDGIPEKYEDLSLLQKKFLQMVLAPRAAYFLGIIDKVYPPNSDDLENKVISIINEYGMSNEVLYAKANISYKSNSPYRTAQPSILRVLLDDPYDNLLSLYTHYKNKPDEKCPETVKRYITEFKQLITTEREDELFRKVAQETNQPANRDKEVVVIYGAGHMKRLKELFSANLDEYEGIESMSV